MQATYHTLNFFLLVVLKYLLQSYQMLKADTLEQFFMAGVYSGPTHCSNASLVSCDLLKQRW